MIKKAFAAAATVAIGVVGFAPTSSAQIGGCANPEVCGFINSSGFLIFGFAHDTFGFIGNGFFGSPTPPSNLNTAVTPPGNLPPSPTTNFTQPSTNLGEWNLGSLPIPDETTLTPDVPDVVTPTVPQFSLPDISALLANLPHDFDFDLVDSTAPVASSDGGFDAAAVAPVALGLMGLYGVLMVTVRRRGALAAV